MKRACLTIDDGPSEHAREKADFLALRNIPAVWFCRGETLEQRPELASYLIKRGFIIGNHSYDHPHFSARPLAECAWQIELTDRIIDDLHARCGRKRPARYFRFPYGDKGGNASARAYEKGRPYTAEGLAKKQELQGILLKLGFTRPSFPGITYRYFNSADSAGDVDWLWTYDAMEWGLLSKRPPFGIDSPDKVFARMDEDVPEGGRGLNHNGSDEIVLVHDFAETRDLFYPIIERLLNKGLTFISPLPS